MNAVQQARLNARAQVIAANAAARQQRIQQRQQAKAAAETARATRIQNAADLKAAKQAAKLAKYQKQTSNGSAPQVINGNQLATTGGVTSQNDQTAATGASYDGLGGGPTDSSFSGDTSGATSTAQTVATSTGTTNNYLLYAGLASGVLVIVLLLHHRKTV